MDRKKKLEEDLREAACIGDIETVEELVKAGVNVNSKHDINGWTALHWAAKRGHRNIVTFLLANGADFGALTNKGETPCSLCANPEIQQLLTGDGSIATPQTINQTLPITANYLKNPPLNTKLAAHKSGGTEMATLMPNPSLSRIAARQDEELVLKIRVANTGDPDFIEVEIPRTDLTYSCLLRVCCEELGINAKHIVRVRKLPDTVVRKDKDVQRFQDFQELEFVVDTQINKGKLVLGNNGLITYGNGNSNVYPPISTRIYKNQTILY